MKVLEVKYAKLERELLELREKTKNEIVEFLEGEVGIKLSVLSRHRLNIEARLKHSHQVNTSLQICFVWHVCNEG